MKNVIIIGASGSLAKYVIQSLGQIRGVKLSLFVRNKKRLTTALADKAVVIEGDAMNLSDLNQAIKGQDIVYVNLAGDLETMSKNIVTAMQQNGVKRIIAISSIGIYTVPLKPVLIPYRKLADVIEDSGLDYTILRPDWFTSTEEIDYMLTQKEDPETGQAVSRKSIAAFVCSIVENPDAHKNENLGISKPG
ncbi:NAD(P)H-binding protein [Pedobacter panaciterrae]|uniref:NAD(P)H-binding protein n=1 Tax=Pedobacter panaciterrae TaxID=363849 RepID=A0ABU8NKE4_9SPHI